MTRTEFEELYDLGSIDDQIALAEQTHELCLELGRDIDQSILRMKKWKAEQLRYNKQEQE